MTPKQPPTVSDQDYEYTGLLARLWDFLRGDTSRWADRFFYRHLIERYGQPVLDVGCGTGRLLLDYLADGVDIDGVDNSLEMLDLCRQKAQAMGLAPALYEQTMETLDLPRRYRTILVPSSSFQLLTDAEQARVALSRFYEHLQPGGALVMSLMLIWQPGEALETDWELAAERVRPQDGATVRKWSRVRYEPALQLEHTEDRYEILQGDQVLAAEHHRRSPATRWYSQEQALALLRQAGFVDVHLYHEFTPEPARPDDTLWVIAGLRPEA